MATEAIGRRAGLGRGQLAVMLLGRMAFNTAFRVVYPLLAFLATGLEVNAATASLLVTTQVGATLLSPLGGALADARGERAAMLLGLAAFCAGALACALAGSFWPFLAGYGLIGLGTALYMPAVQSYASARSAYAERGQVLGLLELSWALAAFVGVAGLSLLVEARESWSPAYWALFTVGLAVAGLTLRLEPGRVGEAPKSPGEPATGRALLQAGVPAALLFIFCQLLAVELIFVVYATWLEGDFGASTQQLGQIFALLGFAELGGALTATLFTDRIGKRRAVIAGFYAVGLLLLLLPFTGGRWLVFLTVFLLFDLCFEFAIVSTFPLVSGLARRGRGTVLAAVVASIGMGRIVGSLIGPRLFESWGFVANGLLAGTVALVGALVGSLLVHEGHE